MNTEKIKTQLGLFQSKDKFSDEEWKRRGLNPSANEISFKLNAMFNKLAADLVQAIGDGKRARELSSILKKGLKNFSKSDYDTEEREFICDYFFELSEIINIDFKENLNKWMYGSALIYFLKVATFLKSIGNRTETLTQDCTKCEAKLESFITAKQKDIVSVSYKIVKCKSCNEFNLMDWGDGVKSLSFGEYEIVEQLFKDNYTLEKANLRLEQLKN